MCVEKKNFYFSILLKNETWVLLSWHKMGKKEISDWLIWNKNVRRRTCRKAVPTNGRLRFPPFKAGAECIHLNIIEPPWYRSVLDRDEQKNWPGAEKNYNCSADASPQKGSLHSLWVPCIAQIYAAACSIGCWAHVVHGCGYRHDISDSFVHPCRASYPSIHSVHPCRLSFHFWPSMCARQYHEGVGNTTYQGSRWYYPRQKVWSGGRVQSCWI